MSDGPSISLWPWELAESTGAVSLILDQLVLASVGGLVLAVLVWVGTRLWRDMPARAQCALWWAVGLKFLVTLVWLAPVELALLPSPAQPGPAAGVERSVAQPTPAPRATGRDAGSGGADLRLLPEPATGSGASPSERRASGGGGRLADEGEVLATQGNGSALPEGHRPVSVGDRALAGTEGSAAAGERSPAGHAGEAAAGNAQSRTSHDWAVPWRDGLVLMWLLGVVYGVVGIRRELAAAAAIRHRSRSIADPEIRRLFSMLCRHLGIRRHVRLRASEDIGVPLTMGWMRPVVLLPASSFAQRSTGELAMVLGHELLHVRRLDLWAGWVPRLARCLFFFHPLAVLAAREYALAREAACDAELLRELGVAPHDYGRLLVRWRPRRGAISTDAVGCAAASSTFVHLKRRLEMLERPVVSPRKPELARWMVALALVAAVVPLRIIAQAPTAPAEQDVVVSSTDAGVFERVLAVDEPVRLDVVTGAGAINVRAVRQGEVRVVGRAQLRAGVRWRSLDIEALLRLFESDPPVVVSGNVVRIGHDLDPELQRYFSIRYEIESPRETEIRSRTGSGGQEIGGISGPVEATAGSGTIRLSDIGGSAHVRTGSGAIRADGVAGSFTGRTGSGSVSLRQTAAGDVEVTTGSGSSELQGVSGAVLARAGSGRISVEGEQAGQPWELHTGSGSVSVRLPADAGFDLDVQTGSGAIQTEHPVTLRGTVGRGRLSGQVRDGGPVLRVRTGSGGVRID